MNRFFASSVKFHFLDLQGFNSTTAIWLWFEFIHYYTWKLNSLALIDQPPVHQEQNICDQINEWQQSIAIFFFLKLSIVRNNFIIEIFILSYHSKLYRVLHAKSYQWKTTIVPVENASLYYFVVKTALWSINKRTTQKKRNKISIQKIFVKEKLFNEK